MKLPLATESNALFTELALVTSLLMEQTATRLSLATAPIMKVIDLFTFLRKERKMTVPKWLRRKTSVEFARRRLDEAHLKHLEAQIGEEYARALVSYRAKVVILTTKFLEKMEGKGK